MKFGSREICDVTFKALDNMRIGQKDFVKGQPVLMIDTATTSSIEQATNTVYAQGGRGNNRLIAWEGEKTMTFTVEDALISPMGLAVLSGAGLGEASKNKLAHAHMTMQAVVNSDGVAEFTLEELQEELGLSGKTSLTVCTDKDVAGIYGTVVDNAGSGIDYISDVTCVDANLKEDFEVTADKKLKFQVDTKYEGKVVLFDFYVLFSNGVTTIDIKPEDFGGFFYVEASTLFRREDTGKDMAANIIFPRVKIQSGFTITMASSGDPSTFTFTMDAFPAYTKFDRTKKVCCEIQIIGEDNYVKDNSAAHTHTDIDSPKVGS